MRNRQTLERIHEDVGDEADISDSDDDDTCDAEVQLLCGLMLTCLQMKRHQTVVY